MVNKTAPAYRVLELSRYAPSGDNIQPWKFKILDATKFEIHLTDCSDWMIYDKLSTTTHLSFGALLEYIDIASAQFGYVANCKAIANNEPHKSIYEITLEIGKTSPSPLFSSLKKRSVQRKAMGTKSPTQNELDHLKAVMPNGFSVELFTEQSVIRSFAKLLFDNSFVRYAMPEGYKTHAEAIDWRKGFEQFSPIKIPPRALGLNKLLVALTKIALSNWRLFHFIEKYLFGLILPRYLMDHQAVIQSSAIFIVAKDTEAKTHQDMINSGRAMVRFWLMADHLGFGYQPQFTPVLFANYLRNEVDFTTSKRALKRAITVNTQFKRLIGEDLVKRSIFMGRIGRTEEINARSTRMTMKDLLLPTDA